MCLETMPYTTREGVRLHYEESGTGSPVLFIAGLQGEFTAGVFNSVNWPIRFTASVLTTEARAEATSRTSLTP